MIAADVEKELFTHISGVVKNNGCRLIMMNGTSNHVHSLISLGKTIHISELVGDIKRASSGWMKRHRADFYWQEGYGAFSIGQSQVDGVVRYIENQKLHHASSDFKNEFRALLEKYKLDYDERYVWD